jgi:hypothetical protein
MTLWTPPPTYDQQGIDLTGAELENMSNRFLFLYNPPRVTATLRSGGASTTAVAFSPVDNNIFSLTMETSGRRLGMTLLAHARHSVAGSNVLFDVLMDDVTYLSSLTGTALTDGIWRVRSVVATPAQSVVGIPYVLEGVDIPAGVHNFKLYWRGSAAGTSTLEAITQFSVFETP